MDERIKKLRKILGITQQELANRIGIKRNTIATYESGRNEPIDAVISLICREFNVNEHWLRTGEGEMFLQLTKKDELILWANTALNKGSEDFKNRFVDALSKLNENDWELLANIAETLVKQKKNKNFYDDIPNTPEEFEKMYPPIENDTNKKNNVG